MENSHQEFCSETFKLLAMKLVKQELVDFHFKFEEEKQAKLFGVHRVVLAAQSTVFEKSFQGKIRALLVKDISYGNFVKMVKISYGIPVELKTINSEENQPCSNVEISSLEEAIEIYKGGKKYMITRVLNVIRNEVLLKMAEQLENIFKIIEFVRTQDGEEELFNSCKKILDREIWLFLTDKSTSLFLSEPIVPENVKRQLKKILKFMEGASCRDLLQKKIKFSKTCLNVAANVARNILNFETFNFDFYGFGLPQTSTSSTSSTLSTKEVRLHTNKTHILPSIVYSKKHFTIRGLYFKFIDSLHPKGVYLQVHKDILNENCQFLLKKFDTCQEFHMQDVSFPIFLKIVDLMYDFNIILNDFNEIAEFFIASKANSFHKGKKFAKNYVKTKLSESNVDKALAIFKAKQINSLQDECLKFYYSSFYQEILHFSVTDLSLDKFYSNKLQNTVEKTYEEISTETNYKQRIRKSLGFFKVMFEMAKCTISSFTPSKVHPTIQLSLSPQFQPTLPYRPRSNLPELESPNSPKYSHTSISTPPYRSPSPEPRSPQFSEWPID